MSDDAFGIPPETEPPRNDLDDWRAKNAKWMEERKAEYRAANPSIEDQQSAQINQLLKPVMAGVAKVINREIKALRVEFMQELEQVRREVRWVGEPKKRIKTKLSPKEIRRRADRYVAKLPRAPE
jgi:hypothetical protein